MCFSWKLRLLAEVLERVFVNKTIAIKGKEAKGSGALSVSLLSLFSLYHISTRSTQAQTKFLSKQKRGKKDRLIFPISISFLFIFFSISSKFPLFFFFFFFGS